MKIKVYCNVCKHYIFDAETDTLDLPLKGSMFTVGELHNWPAPLPDAPQNDLVCPLCHNWFHDLGLVFAEHPHSNEKKWPNWKQKTILATPAQFKRFARFGVPKTRKYKKKKKRKVSATTKKKAAAEEIANKEELINA